MTDASKLPGIDRRHFHHTGPGIAFHGIDSDGSQRHYAVWGENRGRHEPIVGPIR